MTKKELSKYIGKRCYHKTLGCHGEISKVRELCGEVVIFIEWDNGSRWPYNIEQFEVFIEVNND